MSMNAYRRMVSAVCAVLTAALSMAQGMVFAPEGSTLEMASAKAKEEGKLIFLDCYTQWCGPCKMMARKVFTTDVAGEYINSRYVCLKVDMETEYGATLARKLQVQAYPTFVVFDADAKEIGRFLGSCTPEEFVARVKAVSEDRSSLSLAERWENGERNQAFLLEYLSALTASHKADDADKVAEALLDGKEDTFAADSLLRSVFLRSIKNPYAKAFASTAKNPSQLAAAVGQGTVDAKIQNVLENYNKGMVTEKDGAYVIDQKRYDDFNALLSDLQVGNAAHFSLSSLIELAEKNGDMESYVRHIKEYISNPAIDADDMQLARWAKAFAGKSSASKQKSQMKAILNQRLKDIRSGKRSPMTMIGNMRMSRPSDELLEAVVNALDGKGPQK